MITNAIKKFIISCPYIENKNISINCLGSEIGDFSILNVSTLPTVKKYCDGKEIKQFRFILAARFPFDASSDVNLKAVALFENIEIWIKEQNLLGIFPDAIPQVFLPIKIEVVSSGAVLSSSMNSMQYQMELRLLYKEI